MVSSIAQELATPLPCLVGAQVDMDRELAELPGRHRLRPSPGERRGDLVPDDLCGVDREVADHPLLVVVDFKE